MQGDLNQQFLNFRPLAIKANADQWNAMVKEVHSSEISAPIVSGKYFALTMDNEITFKEYGRQQMKEVSVYEVIDGKIITEQFFYHMGQ